MKTNYKYHILLVLTVLILPASTLSAQRISNIRFQPFGRDVQVNYKLSGMPYDSYAMLSLFVSTDGGVEFIGPLIEVQGDVGKVSTNGEKTIRWKVLNEMDGFDGKVVFELRGMVRKEKVEGEHLVMYNFSGSSYVGLMYGYVAKWGAYIRGKTNFSFADASYTCTDDGAFNYTEPNTYYEVNNTSERSRFGITVGGLFRPLRSFYVYAGGGYGFRRLIWNADTFSYLSGEQTGVIQAINTQHSAMGVEAEAGVMYRYDKLVFSAGVNAIDFDFMEFNGAIGFIF